MRITFQYGTVHECARVTLVGVTADILLVRIVALGQLPLESGRETGAAAASQTAVQKNLDDIVGGHLC